jgi:hypothetical protein
MFDFLQEREREEWFRTDMRRLTFPDGKDRDVEAYRLVWLWFDRSIAYEFGLDQDEILGHALHCAEIEDVDLGMAIGLVLNHFIQRLEAQGADHTDDPIVQTLAKRGLTSFHARQHP